MSHSPTRRTKATIAGIAAALCIGGGGYGIAAAQSSDLPLSGTISQVADRIEKKGGKRNHHHGPRQHAADLAEKLGVSQDDIRDAMKQAHKDLPRPDKAELTAEQREAAQQERAQALADALGIKVEKVASAMQQVREDHLAERVETLTQALDAAVADKTITAADKESFLKVIKADILPGKGPFGGHGR